MGIPLEKVAQKWLKDPEFKAGYDALGEEFALVSLLIEARTRPNLTQAELASKVRTSQSTSAPRERQGGAQLIDAVTFSQGNGNTTPNLIRAETTARRTRGTTAA
jgi:hypothetical protein